MRRLIDWLSGWARLPGESGCLVNLPGGAGSLTSPTWNFPGFYSFEVDFAEREEWYSQNTSTVLTPFQPATSSQYNGQRPKVSVRWQPLDPKYIGALTLRGSYTEAFHAPTLFEMTPAGTQNFPDGDRSIFKVTDP